METHVIRNTACCSWLWLALLSALCTGCASVSEEPAAFTLRHARIATAETAPSLPSTDASALAPVAVAGIGGTAAVAGIATATGCMLLGPFAGACFASVLPGAIAAGAASGAVATGVVVAGTTIDSPEDAATKRKLLDDILKKYAVQEKLVTDMQKEARDSYGASLPRFVPDTIGAQEQWVLVPQVTHMRFAPSESAASYALQTSAKLVLVRGGTTAEASKNESAFPAPTNRRLRRHEEHAFSKHYLVSSITKLTTSEWGANDAAPAREAINETISMLSKAMLDDLAIIQKTAETAKTTPKESVLTVAPTGDESAFPEPSNRGRRQERRRERGDYP